MQAQAGLTDHLADTGGFSSAAAASPTSPRGIDGLVTGESVRRICLGPARERRQLLEGLERHYHEELQRISPSWVVGDYSSAHPPIDVAETVGVPGIVLGAILAGKCRDQHIPVTGERQKRFAEWMQMHCASVWFNVHDAGVGAECAKGIVLALALNDRFTSLNLACNSLGNEGAAIIARVIPDHQSLLHVDLSANDIGHLGGNALFDALRLNRSVTYLDLSSKPGSLRNHLARYNAEALENVLAVNPVLAKLQLMGNSLGAEGAAGLARGLARNQTLLMLDLAGNDLGPKGFAYLAEALGACALEELNLSDNRAGDEGLSALATQLGAIPASSEPGNSTAWGVEGVKASVKYHEALHSMRRAVADLDPSALSISDEAMRRETLMRVEGAAAQLASAVAVATVPLPKLKVLLLAGNGGTNMGIARVEDALQVNRQLERLTLDQSDHHLEWGAKSLVASLPVNTTLRCLSLSQCGLGTVGIIDIAKALAVNQALESLSLKGNPFGEEAAAALGALLGSGAKSLKQLNLSSCRLEDNAGVRLGNGLATNMALETLHLRDNLLREAAGRTIAEALRRHTVLIQLSLELNSIDFRFLTTIKRLLERNARLRERARPKWYRKRIDELKECQKEVTVLSNTLKRNLVRKRKAKMKQAAMLQELKDAQADEQAKQLALEEQLMSVQQQRMDVEEEIKKVDRQLQTVCNEGDSMETQMRDRISNLEDRIAHNNKKLDRTRKSSERFESQALEELTSLRQELSKAEKERDIASASCDAARRHLDSFAASLKSIEEDIAGGADPRQRFVEERRWSGNSEAPRAPDGPKPAAGRGRSSFFSAKGAKIAPGGRQRSGSRGAAKWSAKPATATVTPRGG